MKKSILEHCIKRAKERYDFRYAYYDWVKMNQMITHGESELVSDERPKQNQAVYKLLYYGTTFFPVYNFDEKEITTLLPPDNFESEI